jgi:hypothetical protein
MASQVASQDGGEQETCQVCRFPRYLKPHLQVRVSSCFHRMYVGKKYEPRNSSSPFKLTQLIDVMNVLLAYFDLEKALALFVEKKSKRPTCKRKPLRIYL